MSKFLVETYYTCTFKIIHELNELDEKKLSDIDNRKDGKVEIIDVTINNRKTKKSDGKILSKKVELKDIEVSHSTKNNNPKKLETELLSKASEKSKKQTTKVYEKRFPNELYEEMLHRVASGLFTKHSMVFHDAA